VFKKTQVTFIFQCLLVAKHTYCFLDDPSDVFDSAEPSNSRSLSHLISTEENLQTESAQPRKKMKLHHPDGESATSCDDGTRQFSILSNEKKRQAASDELDIIEFLRTDVLVVSKDHLLHC
jgi:hypothetical protein